MILTNELIALADEVLRGRLEPDETLEEIDRISREFDVPVAQVHIKLHTIYHQMRVS